mgnify:CR=1 FL=1
MSIQKRKERERKLHRERIIDGAIELIEEQGFEKTTMDEIAARAEISKGSLYLYFKDKATLYIAIKKRGLNKIISIFMSLIQKDEKGAVILKKMILSFLEYTTTHLSFTKAMIKADGANQKCLMEDSPAQECEKLTDEIFMLIVRVIQIGKQDGSIQIDMPSKLLGLMISLHMNGILQFVLREQDHKGQKILIEHDITLPQLIERFLDIQFSNTQTLNEN